MKKLKKDDFIQQPLTIVGSIMNQFLKKNIGNHIIIVGVAFLLAIVCTVLFSHKAIGQVSITVQEECNPKSSNNQVRLRSVIGNAGSIYELSTLASKKGWEYDSEAHILGYYGGEERTITLDCNQDSEISLRFQKQSSSGIIQIEGANIDTKVIDLYDSEWTYYETGIHGKVNLAFIPLWFAGLVLVLELLRNGIIWMIACNSKILTLGTLLVLLELFFAFLFWGMYPEQVILLDSSDLKHIRYKGLEARELGWISTDEDPYVVVNFDDAVRVKTVQVTVDYMSEQDLWGQIFILDSYEKESLLFHTGDNKVTFPVHFRSKYIATGVRLDVVSKASTIVAPNCATINGRKDILAMATRYAIAFWGVIFTGFLVRLLLTKLSNDGKHRLMLGLLVALNPVVIIWSVEHIDGSILSVNKVALLGTYLVVAAFEIIILTISRRMYIAVALVDIVAIVVGLVDYYVTLFRGVPFAFADIFCINTAMDVVGQYEIKITLSIVISVIVTMLIIAASIAYYCYFKKQQYRLKITYRVGIVAVCVIVTICVFNFANIKDLTNTLAVANKYNDSGVILGVMSSLSIVEKPEGYSADKAEEILSIESEIKNNQEYQTPNIIVIMNESFSDFSILGDIETNQEITPFFNSLSTNSIKGYCGVSVYGGGTCNSEYEVLTGNTMAFFPMDSYPYNQYCKDNVNGMASFLGALGYYCIAEHPGPAGNYNRESVYANMGFDETIFENDFSEPEIVRYISDWSTYEKILEKISSVDAPLFMLDVTMQNHGGYGTKTDWDEPIEVIGMDCPNTEEYLSSVHVSDLALRKLLETIQNCEEPTYVLFFGDHFPNTADGFVDNMLTSNEKSAYTKYFTPFVIWSNVDMQSQTDIVTSTNYLGAMLMQMAGVELPKYFFYLTKLQEELPIVTALGYGDETNWHTWNQESEYQELLSEYSIVQYYNYKQK